MVAYCAVPGCHNSSANSRLSFYRFPKDIHRNEIWKSFAKRGISLPNFPRLCQVHFDPSQFEQNRKDGWHKLKWSAVPTLHPPAGHGQTKKKKFVQECLTETKPDISLKLTDGEEFESGASETSVNSSADMVTHLGGQEESEIKEPSRKLCTLSVNKNSRTLVVRDRKVLKDLLRTLAKNIQKVSFQLQETSNKKCQLMQAVKALTQEEIVLQRQLKQESDKENVAKEQLKEIEDEEKEKGLWKEEEWKEEEEQSCEELDTLMEQNERQDMRTECLKVEEPCCEEQSVLPEKDDNHSLPIAAKNKNDLVAKNIHNDTSAAQQIDLKLFSGFVAIPIINNLQFLTLKLFGNENETKSSDSNPGLLKDSTNLTDLGDTAQVHNQTMFAEPLAEKTNEVEGNRCDQSTRPPCGVETELLSPRPMPPPRIYECVVCEKNFLHARDRQHHELTTHGMDYRCNVCNKVFWYREPLIQHKKTHSDEKPFGCTLCEQRFRSNGTLARHFRYHTGEKHYACSVCSERFFYPHQRRVHMSVHTGKHPYWCKECKRSFTSCRGLTDHLRIHSGEKPYKCDVCGKRFRQREQVKAHKETHGEKPYVCYRCGKRLGVASFWPHMKTHSGIKVYHQCAVCDKKLSTKKSLEMHMRMVHMGEAPYVCDICSMEFGKRKDYQLHKKAHDSVQAKVL